MSYVDIIASQEISNIKFNVIKGNIIEFDGVKVLPINEFFSIDDNDWRAEKPKSVLGQYIKQLSITEREKFQSDIDTALGRNRSDEGQTGYAYGWTIAINVNNEIVLLTNTVKYELPISSETFTQMKAKEEGNVKKYAFEYWWDWAYNAPKEAVEENDSMFDKRRVYYDTFLLAIEMCIEGIFAAAEKNQIPKIALPLLGAGWGGLDEKLVCQAIISFISRYLPTQKGGLQEVTLILPLSSSIDRQFVLQDVSTSLLYGACPDCGKHHHKTPAEHMSRILQDELDIAERLVAENSGNLPLALAIRRNTLKSLKVELDKKYPSNDKEIALLISQLHDDIGKRFDEIKQGQRFIYSHIGLESQNITNLILNQFRQQAIEQGETQRILDAIRRVLKHIQSSGLPINDREVKETLDDIYQSLNSNLDLHQQLELTLPVIPFLLEYKIGLDAGVDLEAVWTELINRIRNKG